MKKALTGSFTSPAYQLDIKKESPRDAAITRSIKSSQALIEMLGVALFFTLCLVVVMAIAMINRSDVRLVETVKVVDTCEYQLTEEMVSILENRQHKMVIDEGDTQ